MSWLLPTVAAVRTLRRAAGLTADRHRLGYWREYHQRNLEKRRAYLAAKRREYRARKA